MKFQVKKWERVFTEGTSCEDTWNNIGIENITLKRVEDVIIGTMGSQVIRNIFHVEITDDFVEIHGFIYNPDVNYVAYRLYPASLE